MFIPPMLASPMHEELNFSSGDWIAEEKYDGHRLVVEISDLKADLFSERTIRGWSRDGRPRDLPRHLTDAISKLPCGVYDGELIVPGTRSYGVTELLNRELLVFVVFDILNLLGEETIYVTYKDRRALLEKIFGFIDTDDSVRLAPKYEINSITDVVVLRDQIWAQNGEGLILKHVNALYSPGKRSKFFIKVKDLKSAVLTITGFRKGRMGPHATVILEDEEGNETTVKTKNSVELARFAGEAVLGEQHPAIGRRLRIEYQERTPDGSYRHPRWDRWEDEEEIGEPV